MQAFFTSKKFLIGIVIVIVGFVAYGAIFVAGNNSASSDAVSRTDVSSAAANGSASSVDTGPGQVFVAQLLAIQSINFNVSLFSDPVFQNLVVSDNVMTPQPQGRDNPFAPFDATGQSVSGGSASSNDLGIAPTAATSTAAPASAPAPASKKPAKRSAAH